MLTTLTAKMLEQLLDGLRGPGMLNSFGTLLTRPPFLPFVSPLEVQQIAFHLYFRLYAGKISADVLLAGTFK